MIRHHILPVVLLLAFSAQGETLPPKNPTPAQEKDQSPYILEDQLCATFADGHKVCVPQDCDPAKYSQGKCL